MEPQGSFLSILENKNVKGQNVPALNICAHDFSGCNIFREDCYVGGRIGRDGVELLWRGVGLVERGRVR